MSKIWAIMGGGDWADALVEFFILEGELKDKFEELLAEYRKYNKQRIDIMRINEIDGTVHPVPNWIGLGSWILTAGGRRPTEDELEEFWDE